MRVRAARAMSRAVVLAAIVTPCAAGASFAGSSVRLTIAPIVVPRPVVQQKILSAVARDAASGLPTGKRTYQPLVFGAQR